MNTANISRSYRQAMILLHGQPFAGYRIGHPINLSQQAKTYEASIPPVVCDKGRIVTALTRPTVIIKTATADAPEGQRLAWEAQHQKDINHPDFPKHIADGIDAETELFYLAMEKLEGKCLVQRLREGKLGLLESISILIDLCAPLSALHQAGLIHRDLKPGNIFLSDTGTKLLDLGLVFDIREQSGACGVFRSGGLVGTPEYCAPEQVQLPRLQLDQRTDIYSLGLVAYEMITGHIPIKGGNDQETAALQVTQALPAISIIFFMSRFRTGGPGNAKPILNKINGMIAKATNKDMGERFQDVESLESALFGIRTLAQRIESNPK